MAKDLSRRRGGKPREFWLDPQPASTLRDICGSIICLCWAGHTPLLFPRLTERLLEFRFGRVRSCFGNAQLSIGDYFRASLEQMKKDSARVLPEPKVSTAQELSEKQFVEIADRAFQTAKRFSSFCSGIPEEELASMHKMTAPEVDDGSEPANTSSSNVGPETTAADVFLRIRASEEFVASVEGNDDKAFEDLKEECEDDTEVAAATKDVFFNEVASVQDACPKISKTTLRQVLQSHKNLQSSMSDLWKLLFYLRHGELGCDVGVLPKPLSTRSVVMCQPRKWHNIARQSIARMDMDAKQPALRQSRMAAWMGNMDECRKKIAPSLPKALTVDRGDVLAVKFGETWEVGMVVSIWRQLQGRSGDAQLSSSALPLGSLKALRVVRSSFWFYFFFSEMQCWWGQKHLSSHFWRLAWISPLRCTTIKRWSRCIHLHPRFLVPSCAILCGWFEDDLWKKARQRWNKDLLDRGGVFFGFWVGCLKVFFAFDWGKPFQTSLENHKYSVDHLLTVIVIYILFTYWCFYSSICGYSWTISFTIRSIWDPLAQKGHPLFPSRSCNI